MDLNLRKTGLNSCIIHFGLVSVIIGQEHKNCNIHAYGALTMKDIQHENVSYVLVTVAYNEEGQIEKTIDSVIKQTILPRMWIIVSDGSTDQTDQIIQEHARGFPWIRYERLEKTPGPIPTIGKASFAYARAMSRARNVLANLNYDFIGNLDADITFNVDYFERILFKVRGDSQLGITGGGAYSVLKNGVVLNAGFIQPDFVGGPVQLFRKQCLDDIDGYQPYDHADVVAVFMARMKGWKVRCFPEIRAYHHGQPENSIKAKMPICFKLGQADYVAGSYFPFFFGRCTLRLFHEPLILAGISMFAGFLWAAIQRKERRMPSDLRNFMIRDQKQKIMETLKLKSINPYRI